MGLHPTLRPAGDSVSRGQEPRSKATIYDVKLNDFKVEISGTGALRQSEENSEDASGPSIEQIPPRILGNMTWILVLAFSVRLSATIEMRLDLVQRKLQSMEDEPRSFVMRADLNPV